VDTSTDANTNVSVWGRPLPPAFDLGQELVVTLFSAAAEVWRISEAKCLPRKQKAYDYVAHGGYLGKVGLTLNF
jgi:hypothetical protein